MTSRSPTPAAVVHGLWRDRRLLRSPLWLVATACVLSAARYPMTVSGVLLAEWQFLWGLARLPSAVAMGCVAWAAHRTVVRGLGRDWRLTASPDHTLERAVFVAPWWLFWILMSVSGLCGLWSLLGMLPADQQFIATPIRFGPIWLGRPSDALWTRLSLMLTILLIPAMVALWAWFYRWLTQALVMRLRHTAMAWLIAVILCGGLSLFLLTSMNTLIYSTAMGMQDTWPPTWSLGARLFCGAYLAWLAQPALLLVLGLTACHFARRWRHRWWERMV